MVAATVTFGHHHLHDDREVVAIPLGVPRETCDGIPAATDGALASEEAVFAPEEATVTVVDALVAERAKPELFASAVVTDCADDAALGNEIGYGCDVLEDLHHRYHTYQGEDAGHRSRSRNCLHLLRCTSS